MTTEAIANTPTETAAAEAPFLRHIFNLPNFVYGFVNPAAPADPQQPEGKTLQVKLLEDFTSAFQKASLQDLSDAARAESFESTGRALALSARGLVRLIDNNPGLKPAAEKGLEALDAKIEGQPRLRISFEAALEDIATLEAKSGPAPTSASPPSYSGERIKNPDHWPTPVRVVRAIEEFRTARAERPELICT